MPRIELVHSDLLLYTMWREKEIFIFIFLSFPYRSINQDITEASSPLADHPGCR